MFFTTDVAMGSEEQEKLGEELHWCIADLNKVCCVPSTM